MRKDNFDGKGTEERVRLNWVELSERIEPGDDPENAIVSETLSQIVSEDLKIDTSDMEGVREAVDSFYAYGKQQGAKKISDDAREDREQAIRKSVDEKIIIRSEELKHRRRSANKPKSEKLDKAIANVKKRKERSAHEKAGESFRQVKGLEKYRKLGILPTKKNGPSQFRQEAAKWRYDDVPEAPITDEAIEQEIADSTLIDRLKSMSYVQWGAVAMAVVLLVTSVMTTTVYADYRGELNKESAMAQLPSFTDDASMIAYNEDGVFTEDVEMDEAAAPADSTEGKMLSLILTSVEKDLKVKLVDQDDTLVKGIKWGITVTDDKEKESSYEDDDEDGIIHLTGISAGDYSVAITDSDALAGYVYPTVGQKVSVKAKVEYKVIANIKDEIKKESEVNAAAEDNGNKAADVETASTLTDTVEFVESSRQETGGETYEEATVDLTKSDKLVAFADRLIGSIGKIARAAGARTREMLASIGLSSFGRMVATEVTDDTSSSSAAPAATDTTTTDTTTTDTTTGQPDSSSSSSAHEHSYTETAKTDPTCTEKGSRTLTCGCGDTKTEDIPALGHDYKDGVCTRCGAKDPNYKAPACDHKYNVVTTKEPTCLEAGVKVKTCTICGEKVEEAIPSLGHDFKDGVCTRCGEKDPNYTKYDPKGQLYDSGKNPLYVLDNGTYRLAKYSDYDGGGFTKFFRKVVGYIYTGWQNIDGRTYYYTKDHEYVTGDQIIGGVAYKFNSDGSLNVGSGVLGIDVSKYQPSINWNSVRDSGIDFVIIRCGYRGASTGVLIEDPYFKSHIKGAKSAGLKVGVYYFSTALTEAEAVEEASAAAALCSGYGINYPVFLDVESSSRPGYNTLSPAQRTANIKAFCQTIASAGYTPGLYANKTWLTEKINTGSLSCKIWLAQYRADGPTYSGRYDIWQYTSKGSVSGISGNVDMNKSFLRY